MVYKVGDVLIKTHNTRIFSHPSAMGRMWRINKSNILFVSQLSHSDDAMETIFLFTSEHSNVQVSSPFGGNSLFLTGTDYTIFRFHQISFRLNMKLCHRDGATRRSWVGGAKEILSEASFTSCTTSHKLLFNKFPLRNKKHLAMCSKPFILILLTQFRWIKFNFAEKALLELSAKNSYLKRKARTFLPRAKVEFQLLRSMLVDLNDCRNWVIFFSEHFPTESEINEIASRFNLQERGACLFYCEGYSNLIAEISDSRRIQ